MLSRLTWLALLRAALVAANEVLPNLSFAAPYSSVSNRIDHFTFVSSGPEIKVYSDRVILTPPYPGNARGAIWSDQKTSAYDWETELVFRANGPSGQSSGNLQLWVVDDTSPAANSVYTVSKFDGLVIVVDQYGGSGGKIRGFLNDGTKAYNMAPNVESLAFGHCDYSYRNRGAPSTLKITNHNGLTVSIDGTQCFHSDKIVLPPGLHFGISAATAENPDSFEITSLTTRSLGAITHPGEKAQVTHESFAFAPRDQPVATHDYHESSYSRLKNPYTANVDPEQNPDQIIDHQRQFNDLHTRLTHMANTLGGISELLLEQEDRIHNRHELVMKNVAWGADVEGVRTQVNALVDKVASLERAVGAAAAAGRGDSSATLSATQIEEIKKAAKHASPSMFTLALTMMAVQVVLVGAFAAYTNRSSRHSKYL